MSILSTLTHPQLTLRKLKRLDLLRLTHIEERLSPPRWTREDFLSALLADGGAGTVAEIAGQAVGFVLYKVTPPPDGSPFQGLRGALQAWLSRGSRGRNVSRRIDLLHIAVHAYWQRQGIGSALLEEIHWKHWLPGDSIQAIVPEMDLDLQAFLVATGYKEVNVLPGYFGEQDGHVMEHQGHAAGQ